MAKILEGYGYGYGYGYAMRRTMVNEDEPDHMERRRLLTDAFLPERLMDYEPTSRSNSWACPTSAPPTGA